MSTVILNIWIIKVVSQKHGLIVYNNLDGYYLKERKDNMSYTKKHGNDLLEDYFLNLNEFMKMTKWLDKAYEKRDADTFFVWFEKMALCDKRSLALYLIKNDIALPGEYRRAILFRLKDCLSIEKIAALPTWEGGEA